MPRHPNPEVEVRVDSTSKRWRQPRHIEVTEDDKNRILSLLDSTAEPTNFFSSKYPPLVSHRGEELRWVTRGKHGESVVLATSPTAEGVYLEVDVTRDYCVVTMDSRFFLMYPIFIHKSETSIPFFILDSTKLTEYVPGEPVREDVADYRKVTGMQWLQSKSIDTFHISKKLRKGHHDFDFPSYLKFKEEILVLFRLPPETESLLILWPNKRKLFVPSRKWVNKFIFDGYQWVSRVARDPKTMNVVVEGVRVGVYLLDANAERFLGWVVKDDFYKPWQRW